jgi:hypothetical protein
VNGYQLGGITILNSNGSFTEIFDPSGANNSGLFLGTAASEGGILTRSPSLSIQNIGGSVTYRTFNSAGLTAIAINATPIGNTTASSGSFTTGAFQGLITDNLSGGALSSPLSGTLLQLGNASGSPVGGPRAL